MGIPEGSCEGSGRAWGSAAAPRAAKRHERTPAHDEPDDVAGLVDEMHEAREVGDRRRAVVAVGELERLDPAQVLPERRQHDGLLVHGWGGLPAGAGWPDWRVGVQGSLPRAWAFDPMRFSAAVVDTPSSRRMRAKGLAVALRSRRRARPERPHR